MDNILRKSQSNREKILSEINQRQGSTTPADPYGKISAPFGVMDSSMEANFVRRAISLQTDMIIADRREDIAEHVAKFLNKNGYPAEIRLHANPEWLNDLGWEAAGVTAHSGTAKPEDRCGVTSCFRAIADTGTLMMVETDDTPSSVSLLPESHVVLLPREKIVLRMEDALEAWQTENQTLPRAINFVSGPSRTADIEQTIHVGIHGPTQVCVILFD